MNNALLINSVVKSEMPVFNIEVQNEFFTEN